MKVTDITFENWKDANLFVYELLTMGYSDISITEYPPTNEIEKGWTVVTFEHSDEDTILIQNTARTQPILNVQTFNLHIV